MIVPYAVLALVVAYLSSSHFTWPDEADYYKLAYNLSHFHIYSLDGTLVTAYRPPGYTFFLAALLYFSHNIAFLHYSNFILWLCSACLTFRVTKTLYGDFAGLVALLWTMEYALGVYTSMFLYPQILASTLFLSSLYVHLKVNQWGPGWRVLEGFLFGMLILTVPMYLFALPCLLVLTKSESGSFWRVLLILACIALPPGMWTIRNCRALHTYVFIATQDGHELLVGNSPNAAANRGVSTDIHTYTETAERLRLDEVQTDRFYRQSAVDWIVHHPDKWLLLYVEKLLNWFNFRNELAVSAQGSNFRWAVMFVTWYSLLGVALLRMWLRTDRWTGVDLYLWGVYLSGALSYAIFFTRLRYRLPYDYVLIIQAAACIDELRKGRGWSEGWWRWAA
jgi:hypothetical protein